MIGELLAATGLFFSLAGGIIAIYVSGSKQLALSHQKNDYTQSQLEKLEVRVKDIEQNIALKIDKIDENIMEIKLILAKAEK